ncbi:MAG: proton-conducting transporter membrane subunit [Nitrospiria bacterium]
MTSDISHGCPEMNTFPNISQVAVLIPILGAFAGLLFRKRPKGLLLWFQGMSALLLAFLCFVSDAIFDPASVPLVFMVTLSAFFAVLGRRLKSTPAVDLFEIGGLCGLGLGFLLTPHTLSLLFLIGVFALLIAIQLRTAGLSNPGTRWVIGLYGMGILWIMVAFSLSGAAKQGALFLACLTLLPLFPFHGAYTSLLKGLSGVLPAFLAIFLPALGLYGLLPLLPGLPDGIKGIIQVCAALGMAMGALRALAQIRIPHLLAQCALVFWSILWLALCLPAVSPAAGTLFLSAAGLTLCGLFLSWHGLKARYGDLLLDHFSGLASVMPRFSILFALLIMAATGLPFLGVFSGLIELAFSPSMTFSWGFVLILTAWFFMSWRLPLLMQQTLFRKSNPNWMYHDYTPREAAALALIVITLVILGLAPYALPGLDHLNTASEIAMKTK